MTENHVLLELAALPPMTDEDMLILQLVIQLVVGGVFGIVCAIMAPDRGRSAVGWFFIGFFLGCVGLIILLLIPNLKVEAEKQRRHEEETRRLREQLKKERQVADQRYDVHGHRLTAHDRALGVDTAPAELPHDEGAPPPLPENAGAPAAPARQWFYAVGGERHGPVSGEELRSLWLDEQVPDSAIVWSEGMGDWQPIGEVGDMLGGRE